MHHTKILSLSTLTASLVLFAGCTTQTATNTESASGGNVNVANDNAAAAVVTNTNAEQGSEVDLSAEALAEADTSDWLTYTNEEYGFSLKYPNDWEINVIDENDEGGMGLGLGDIVLSSNICRAVGTELKAGSISSIKSALLQDKDRSLEEIDSDNIQGIKYYDVVNENNYKGYIYLYRISESEMSFNLVDNPDDSYCESFFDEIMSSIALNS